MLEEKFSLHSWQINLVKSNVSDMPNYVISCFKCPAKITKAIDNYSRDFFWGSNRNANAVAWNQVCTPKDIGCLGVRPSAHIYNAAVAKLA